MIGKVQKKLEFKHKIWKLNKVQLKELEKKNRHLQEHLLGLKFNMEDQKLQCEEQRKEFM
jgi:transcriptional regulator of heat shock response